VAPAGVSQIIDHAPCVERTVPLGCAASAVPDKPVAAGPIADKAARKTTFTKVLESPDLESPDIEGQAVMTAPLRITAL
jgi:hypothetical protein